MEQQEITEALLKMQQAWENPSMEILNDAIEALTHRIIILEGQGKDCTAEKKYKTALEEKRDKKLKEYGKLYKEVKKEKEKSIKAPASDNTQTLF